MVYCAGKLVKNSSYFIKAMDHTFYGFTGVTLHFVGCWENTRKVYVKLSITSFSRVLPTPRVGYHGGKPIKSVVFC